VELRLIDPEVGLLVTEERGAEVAKELTAEKELPDSVAEEEMISSVELRLLDT